MKANAQNKGSPQKGCFCITIFLVLFVSSLFCSAYAAIPSIEREALIALYNSTDGDNWYYNDGWKNPPLHTDGFAMPGTECDWKGISCDWIHNIAVERVGNLSYNQLTGTIPPEIGNLTNLIEFNLSHNQLTGSIPPELGNLTNLWFLDLRENQLTGSIPPELGNLTNLLFLDLAENQLTDSIPPEFGNLVNLYELWLSYNQLTGIIPPEMGNLVNLRSLFLDWNQLTGSIPPELGDMVNLYSLSFDWNQLTGSIPPELGNLTNLHLLRLDRNQLTGSIPPELGNLTNLIYFLFMGNKLTSEIPTSLINLVQLSFAELGYNALYTYNPDLKIFLENVNPEWDQTQTIAPENIIAESIDMDTIRVSWSPILYTDDPGGYRVFYSTISGGPYNLFDVTENKSITEMDVNALQPDTTYYFVVQTWTDPHANNSNVVESEYSEEVHATITSGVTPDIKANGQDNPLFVTFGTSVDLSISLDPGILDGQLCEWWGILMSSYGTFPLFGFQALLFDLPETKLFETPLLPGWYIFFFNVEDTPNGSFQSGWYDYVVVVVQTPGSAHGKKLPDVDALVREKIKQYTDK